MAQRSAGHTRGEADVTEATEAVSRRRVLQVAGAGLLGTALGVGRAGAADEGATSAVPTVETGQAPASIAADGPVGGGAQYGGFVGRGDADAVVASRDELEAALSSAGDGDAVLIDGDARIDVGTAGLDVPAGVTLASNRGVYGAPGALLRTDAAPSAVVRLRGGARLTGVRLRGPNTGSPGGSSSRASGVTVAGADVEIDNCLIRGFAYAGVFVEGGDAHVHHSVIRECNKGGLGYGVSTVSGKPTIEYNYFNHNRHSVASDGSHHGYVCRYNHFGPDLTSHVIDAHEPAGTRYEIHDNVVEGVVDAGGERRPAVAIRGAPDDAALIEDNWFWNPTPPGDAPSSTWTEEAIIQPETGSSWANVSFSGNHYGEDAGVTFGDVIPGYDGWRAEPDRA